MEEFQTKGADLSKRIDLISNNVQTLAKAVANGEIHDKWKVAQGHVPEITASQTAFMEHWRRSRDLLTRLGKNVAAVGATTRDILTRAQQEIIGSSTRSKRFSLATALGGLMLMLGFSYWIFRSITLPLKRAISGLSEGADQVKTASEQISTASQTLAEGSSEQAASIEETSSSLEEMSSMTQQNAASAEESASASEEMSTQAEAMKGMVNELQSIVGGSSKVKKLDADGACHAPKNEKPRKAMGSASNKFKAKAGSVKKSAKPLPEAMIPLDDDKQFSDF